MLEMECDHCGYKIQIIDRKFPSNWIYYGDFEFCPDCKQFAEDKNTI